MNHTSVSFFFFFTLSLILVSATATQLIDDACKTVQQQSATCADILRSDPRIAAARNKKELAKLTLKMCVTKATEAQHLIKSLAATTRIPALQACATSHYDYVVESFKSSLGEITEDPDTSNYDAKVAGDGASYCDQAMADAHVINPIVSAKNKDILMLSLVAFAVTNNLSQQL